MRQQIREYFMRLDRQAQGKRGRIEYEASKVFRRYLNQTTTNVTDLNDRVRIDLMQAMDRLIRTVFGEPMTISIGFGIRVAVINEAGDVRVISFHITSLYVNDVDLMRASR